jgi:hypothetical protein
MDNDNSNVATKLFEVQDVIIKIQEKTIEKMQLSNCGFIHAILKRPNGKSIVAILDEEYVKNKFRPISATCNELYPDNK